MHSRTVMERVVAAFNTGDLSEVDALFAAGYVDHQKPAWLELEGPDEFKQIVRSARRGLQHLHVTIEDLIAQPTAIAARLHWHGIDATGATIDQETIEILHLAEGQIVEHWGAEAWTRSSDEA